MDNDNIFHNTLGNENDYSHHVQDGSIDNFHLADDSVSTSKIQDSAVTNPKINNGSIDVSKLQSSNSQFDFGALNIYSNKLKFESGLIEKTFSGNSQITHSETLGGIILAINGSNKINIQKNNIDFYQPLFMRNNNIQDIDTLELNNITSPNSSINVNKGLNLNSNAITNIGSLPSDIITGTNISDNAVTTSKINIDNALNFNSNDIENPGVFKGAFKVNTNGVNESFEITDGVNSTVRINHLSGGRNLWSVNYNHTLELGKQESDNSLTAVLTIDHDNSEIDMAYPVTNLQAQGISITGDNNITESGGTHGFKFDNTNSYVENLGTHIFNQINFDKTNTAINNIQYNVGEIKILPNNFCTIANTLKMSSNEINGVSNLKSDKIECPEYQDQYLDLRGSTDATLNYYKHVVIQNNNIDPFSVLNTIGAAVYHQFTILNVSGTNRDIQLYYGAVSQDFTLHDMVSGSSSFTSTNRVPITIKGNKMRIITLWGQNTVYIK